MDGPLVAVAEISSFSKHLLQGVSEGARRSGRASMPAAPSSFEQLPPPSSSGGTHVHVATFDARQMFGIKCMGIRAVGFYIIDGNGTYPHAIDLDGFSLPSGDGLIEGFRPLEHGLQQHGVSAGTRRIRRAGACPQHPPHLSATPPPPGSPGTCMVMLDLDVDAQQMGSNVGSTRAVGFSFYICLSYDIMMAMARTAMVVTFLTSHKEMS